MQTSGSAQPRNLHVVIPVRNGAEALGHVLTALSRTSPNARVLVVDDASTDDSAACARSHGAEVLTLAEREGPAGARNRGAAAIDSEIVLFLDADCEPLPGLLDQVANAFARDPDLVAVSGSYHAEAGASGFFSRYMNLRHHYFHHDAPADTAAFWSGCGAVKRSVFLDVGGFDVDRFSKPQIEDIELGQRLGDRGKVRLNPSLQVRHLKHWTLRSVVTTDVRDRGVPWTNLILESGRLPNTLNLKTSQRVAALLSPLSLAATLALPWSVVTQRWMLTVFCVATILGSLGLNVGLLKVFEVQHGLRFAARAGMFHQIHLIYSSLTFLTCVAVHFGSLERQNLFPDKGSLSLIKNSPRLAHLLRSAFARYDPVALGTAIATVCGSGLFSATAILLIKGGDPIGPNLSLLSHFLTGYSVTWTGAILGLFEGAACGFAFGWLLAASLNALISWHQAALIRELQRTNVLSTPAKGPR